MTSHSWYDLLGVAPDATPDEIRSAYRRAAREHHPDRQGDRSSARMADINRAWSVLGDAATRREYDRTLADPVLADPVVADPRTPAAEPGYNPLARYQDPPRFPWRFMAVLALLGLVFVAVGVATAPDPVPPKVDNVLQPGDCVAIEANGDASERLCTEQHDGVVEVFLAQVGLCPSTAEPHRDRQGMGIACVRMG